ncbi:MAG: hypothetical protein HDR94_08420 [Bacteroides sp.]|nr:hypothetical protein [Bacteroides sp.]
MSKVLVIGNGFDIALGLRSKYADFVNTMTGTSRNAFWPFRDAPVGKYANCSLHRHFYDYFQANKDDAGHIRWIDLENELLKYARNKIGLSIDEELVREDENSFNMLKMMLQKYISVMPTIKPMSPDKNFIRLLKAIRTSGEFDKAYSFNYTNLQDELIRFGEFEIDKLPSVVNIHRAPSDENFFNIVLGINEDPSIPKGYRFMFKSSQADSTNLSQDMAKANEVIFYGISFGEIDFIYFKSFFKHIANQSILDSKKHITIFTFGKNSVESIQDSLYAMGVLIQDLKENSNFSIVDMEKLWLPGYDETAFNNTITRLEEK